MAKSLSPAERVAHRLTAINTAINTAVEALFKHTTKAISIRDKATRTTPALCSEVLASWASEPNLALEKYISGLSVYFSTGDSHCWTAQ